MYHEFYELCTLVTLATAILNIRPVSILSNPEEHVDLFLFCLSITIGMLLIIGRSLEVKLLIENEPAAVIASKREAIMYSLMTIVFASATIYSGVKYFGHNSIGDSYYDSAYSAEGSGYGESGYGESTYEDYNKTSSYEEDDHHFLFRFLAGSSSYGAQETNNYSGDIAMALMFAGFCLNHLFWFLVLVQIIPLFPANGDIRT